MSAQLFHRSNKYPDLHKLEVLRVKKALLDTWEDKLKKDPFDAETIAYTNSLRRRVQRAERRIQLGI